MPRSVLTSALVPLLMSTLWWGCQRGPAAQLAAPPKYEPEGQSKCNVQASPTRPLVVEWPAADRASLEARLGSGLVAVRAEGCEIEVLRRCSVPGNYAYRGLTRKNDQVVIQNADELYAQLPIGAARLEGKLARSGMLDVRMALVGMLEAPHEPILTEKLSGDCHGATHVIAGVQLGAFEFFAGGSGEVGAGIGIGGAGAGGRSSASQELLSADGDPEQCDASSSSDTRPPEGCGAVIRIELARLGVPDSARLEPTCPPGSTWEGGRCVITETFCPGGTQRVSGQCVARPIPPPPGCPAGMSFQPGRGCVQEVSSDGVFADEDAALPHEICSLMFRCRFEHQGQPIPEGEPWAATLRDCESAWDGFKFDAFTRQRARACLAGGCTRMNECARGQLLR